VCKGGRDRIIRIGVFTSSTNWGLITKGRGGGGGGEKIFSNAWEGKKRS